VTDFRAQAIEVFETTTDHAARGIIAAILHLADTVTTRSPEAPEVPTSPRQVLSLLLSRFEEEDRATVGTKDFMEYADLFGRSRPWVVAELPKFVEEGRLGEPSDGRYPIIRKAL